WQQTRASSRKLCSGLFAGAFHGQPPAPLRVIDEAEPPLSRRRRACRRGRRSRHLRVSRGVEAGRHRAAGRRVRNFRRTQLTDDRDVWAGCYPATQKEPFMAENENIATNRNLNQNAENDRKDMEKQISDLKAEVASLTQQLSERGKQAYEDLREDAEGLYDEASRRARRAGRQLRSQANAVSETIRDNPGTAATLLSSAGLIG